MPPNQKLILEQWANGETETTETVGPVGLLVRDAELLVTMTGEELRGGWVAIQDGFVKAVGGSRDEPAEAAEVLSASGCLITPGLINKHHHIYQNLTRSLALARRLAARRGLGRSRAPGWPESFLPLSRSLIHPRPPPRPERRWCQPHRPRRRPNHSV